MFERARFVRSACALVAVCSCVFALGFAWAGVSGNGTAGKGTKLIVMEGIVGPLGYQGGASGGTGMKASGSYGHHVTGPACSAAKKETYPNELSVVLSWSSPGASSYTVDATAKITDKNYTEVLSANNGCPTPIQPSFTGSSSVKLSKPGVGSASTSPAGSWSPDLGAGSQAGNEQEGAMDPYTWNVDPNNPSTHTCVVKASVSCEFDGDAEDVEVDSKSTATCELSVTVS